MIGFAMERNGEKLNTGMCYSLNNMCNNLTAYMNI